MNEYKLENMSDKHVSVFSLQNVCVEDILLEMREQLAKSRMMETHLVKPLFDALLRVALGTYFADLDHSEEKKEKVH